MVVQQPTSRLEKDISGENRRGTSASPGPAHTWSLERLCARWVLEVRVGRGEGGL